jgi:EXPERA (EXPanded EBP superfamily)
MATTPLRARRLDWVILAFFAINLGFITYIVDIEQLTIADSAHFDYPLWPPRPFVDLVHWWGHHFDPLLMARPPWWRATIWLDSLLFGPFYAVAIWAIWKGKEWIRVPAIFWAGVMFANVSIIMFEELLGPYRTPEPFVVTMANLPWWSLPFLVTYRFAREGRLFSAPGASPEASAAP